MATGYKFKYNRSQMCGNVLIFRPLRLSLAVIAQHNVTLGHYVAPVQYLACCTMAQACTTVVSYDVKLWEIIVIGASITTYT